MTTEDRLNAQNATQETDGADVWAARSEAWARRCGWEYWGRVGNVNAWKKPNGGLSTVLVLAEDLGIYPFDTPRPYFGARFTR